MKNYISFLIIFVLILILLHASTTAQINTENLRKSEIDSGIYHTIQFDFGFVSGNTNLLNLKGSIRTDYKSGNYYTFGVLQYQREIQNSRMFINKGFIHLRGIRKITRIFHWELFVQKEFNDFILLIDRNLIGSGLRTTLLLPDSANEKAQSVNLYIGIGTMWENEEVNTSPPSETKIFRSTNYISLSWMIDERINFGIVCYYQFHLSNINDYRILFESKLAFNLTKALFFQTSFNLRYDSEPPQEVKNTDLEINNGLLFSF